MIQWLCKRIRFLIKDRNTVFLSIIPIIITAIILIVDDVLYPDGYGGTILEDFLLSLASFTIGFTGIVIVAKKEFPSPSFLPIRGIIAVITGLIVTLIFWFIAYRGLYVIFWRLTH